MVRGAGLRLSGDWEVVAMVSAGRSRGPVRAKCDHLLPLVTCSESHQGLVLSGTGAGQEVSVRRRKQKFRCCWSVPLENTDEKDRGHSLLS